MKSPPARRAELDEVIVNIELTLASIVQGLALSFLAEKANTVLSNGPATAWPYIGAAFLTILLFWSRALIHTLTLIRWPLEFVHNFFYFLCALVEVLAFQHLTDPFMWFVLNAVFAAIVWGLFVHDLRIIRLRAEDSVGPSSSRLYRIVAGRPMAEHPLHHALPLSLRRSAPPGPSRAAPDFFLDPQRPSPAHRLSGRHSADLSGHPHPRLHQHHSVDLSHARRMAR